MHPTRLPAALLAVASLATGANAQQPFTWQGSLAAGRTIEIANVNGDVVAVAGSQLRVTAHKSARRSNPDDVEIRVVEHADGVTICAVYPAPQGRAPNECRPGGGGSNVSRDNDVTVQFRVEVPAGVAFVGRSTNGAVTATGLDSDVRASTTNGGITVSTSGLARASTTNGAIEVSMGRADWTGELAFATTNGTITLTLPASAGADVTAETTNGTIASDFPITVSGRFSRTRLSGTFGDGGRGLRLATTNGDIQIRRR
jgi:hypothetical protein